MSEDPVGDELFGKRGAALVFPCGLPARIPQDFSLRLHQMGDFMCNQLGIVVEYIFLGHRIPHGSLRIWNYPVEDLRLVARGASFPRIKVCPRNPPPHASAIHLFGHEHQETTVAIHIRQGTEIVVVHTLDGGGIEGIQVGQLRVGEGPSGIVAVVEPNRAGADEPHYGPDLPSACARRVPVAIQRQRIPHLQVAPRIRERRTGRTPQPS